MAPLFGKAWMRLMNLSAKSMKSMKLTPGQSMLLGFLTQVVMAYVLAHVLRFAQAAGAAEGMQAAAWVWLGFFATTQLGSVLWEGRPFRLYVLNTLHSLAALLVMGGLLAAWA
jgi:hypothetical protein